MAITNSMCAQTTDYKKVVLVLGCTALLFSLCYFMAGWMPPPTDWVGAYRPACLRVLAGRSPYAATGTPGFFNPVWAILFLLPIAILPTTMGEAVLIFCTVVAFGYAAYRLGGSPISVGLTLISYPAIYCLVSGQIDWLVALGLILPPRWGLLLVMTKPQIGIGIGLYWLWEAWQNGRVQGIVSLIVPTVIGIVSSAIIFLLDPTPGILFQGRHNLSLAPYSIPIGLALLALAAFRHNWKYAIPATPCLSPYIMPHSLTFPMLLGAVSTRVALALSLASWGLALFLYYQ